MHGDELYRLFFGVRPSFEFSFRVFPLGTHIGGERRKAANIIGARHFKKEINVGQCPFCTPRMTLLQDGSNAKFFDCFCQQLKRCGRRARLASPWRISVTSLASG